MLSGCDDHILASFSQTASIVADKCFFHLRELRVRRSLDSDSVVTFIYAFIISRIDYCNCMFAGAPNVCTDMLQQVLNAAHVYGRNEQIRSGIHCNPTHRLALAGCSRKDQIQTVPHDIEVPPWNCTAKPLRIVRSARTYRRTTSATLCYPRSTRRCINKDY